MSHEKVALSSAVRNSLLSLQDTSKLIARTEGRLSTGLRVASPVDDPVAFFQAKALSDRAFDFQERKDGIDQGISTVTAALNGVEAVEHIAQQMKGLTQAMKSATDAQFTDLVRQFNDLRTQINRLTADTTYQGVNLINGTGQILEVEFSEKSDSLLRIDSYDLTYRGLGIGEAVIALSGNSVLEFNAGTAAISLNAEPNISQDSAFSDITSIGAALTYHGPDEIVDSGVFEFTLGSTVVKFEVNLTGLALTQGAVISASYASATGVESLYTGAAGETLSAITIVLTGVDIGGDATAKAIDLNDYNANYVREGDTDQINLALDQMDSALTQLRGDSATLGSNVALLKTRLSFTEDYVNTLEGGAGKLTLADINEEGANLLALQTRQQLGISALAFAGQAEQSILALFN